MPKIYHLVKKTKQNKKYYKVCAFSKGSQDYFAKCPLFHFWPIGLGSVVFDSVKLWGQANPAVRLLILPSVTSWPLSTSGVHFTGQRRMNTWFTRRSKKTGRGSERKAARNNPLFWKPSQLSDTGWKSAYSNWELISKAMTHSLKTELRCTVF